MSEQRCSKKTLASQNSFLLLHWEKEFFSLAEFSLDQQERLQLLRGTLRPLSQASESIYEQTTQHLQEILTSWGVHRAPVYCLLSAASTFLRIITMEVPANLEDAIPALAKLEAEEVIPTPLEEVVWDYQCLPALQQESIQVAYLATKIKPLESLCNAIAKAGLEIQIVDTVPCALYNAEHSVTSSTQETIISSETDEFLKHHPEELEILLGGAIRATQKAVLNMNLLPPSLIAKQQQRRQWSWFIKAVLLLSVILLGSSFYFYTATKRLITASSHATLLLDEEKKSLAESEKALAAFQGLQDRAAPLLSLVEARAAWPQLINELQRCLPSRYVWITKLSPVTEAKQTDPSITAVEIEGLYLENPRQAAVVDDFVNQLKKSDFFAITDKNEESIVTLRCTPDGSAYAYPFKLLLPLRKPMNRVN